MEISMESIIKKAKILVEALPYIQKLSGKTVVINIETLNAMVVALRTGRPFIEKIITLIAKGNIPQKNIKARVGTPVSEILKANKIELEENDKVILGGAMRGKTIYDTDFPIFIETDAVLIQGKDDIIEIDNVPCVNCGKCVDVCPCNLQVNLLSRYSEFSLFEKCEELDIERCIECGLCSYMCMTRRPVVQYLQFAKKEIEKLNKEEEIQ